MEKSIHSELIGTFIYEELSKAYTYEKGPVHWTLEISDDKANFYEIMQRAENLYRVLHEFDKQAKVSIADELTSYKNDFWPEYDEDDEHLDWDEVDAGKYDVTPETFAASIKLLDIVIRHEDIYCEYDDGELFGGHRIHAYFDNDHRLRSAEI
ncbi:DUF2262 domain-containing protein [Paenibacillus xylanilyticus]|uniref:DUF2262 domain-containing protein n=1 Tax=Paenibacillus xylanilyticus TaxID=248903 RepID=UPI00129E7195|nr:DUF2262 domain-containing protein [Paenibacillus xylanilyticus]